MKWNDRSFINVPMISVLSCCWETAEQEKGKPLEEFLFAELPSQGGETLRHTGCAEAELLCLYCG